MSSIFANRSVLGLVAAGAGLMGGLLISRSPMATPAPQVAAAPAAVSPSHAAPERDGASVVTNASTVEAPSPGKRPVEAAPRAEAPADVLASNPRAQSRLNQFAALQSAHESLLSSDAPSTDSTDDSQSDLRVARANEDQTAPATSPSAVTQPTASAKTGDAASKPASRPERKVLTAEEREKSRLEAIKSAQSRAAAARESAASRAATRPAPTPKSGDAPVQPMSADDASNVDDENEPDDDSVGDGKPLMKPQIGTPGGPVSPPDVPAAPGASPSERARPGIKNVGKGRESRIPPRGGRVPSRTGAAGTQHAETVPGEGDPVNAPPIPDDGRSEWFAFKDTPWEEVIQHMARRIGKTLLDNGTTVPGELTYENPRRFTKTEALDELNFLLVEQNYFIDETEHYIRVFPLNEMQKYLELKYMFDSYEAFESANVRDMQLTSVLFQVKDKPAAAIRDATASAMPDRALPVVVGDTNTIRIVGLARDARRFKALLDVVMDKKMRFDPRTMQIFRTKTNARQIEPMVRDLLNVKQPERRMNPQTRQFEMVAGGDDTRIIVDDRTNSLIVKGTPEQLEEVEQLMKRLDEMPDIGTFETSVREVEHGNATEIANLLNQIFQQERGQRNTGPTQRFVPRPGQPGQPQQPQQVNPQGQVTPQDIIVEDIYERAKKTILIVADDRTNSLIVYANKDGKARVEEMLAVIDKPVPTNYRSFELKHADADALQPTVDQIAKAAATARGGKKQPTVIADATMNALHVIADREDMERISDLVKQLDIDGAETQQRFVELKNLKPSTIAGAISGLLGGGGAPAPRRAGPRGGGGTAQVTPLDEAGLLVITCNDEDWKKIEGTIRQWDDRAVTSRPETRFFTIKAGSPDTVANTLRTVYQNYSHPVFGKQQVFVDVLGDQVVALAITPVLDEMQNLVKTLDVPTDSATLVIIPLKLADAATVATTIQTQLLSGNIRNPRGGSSASSTSVSADALTNSLIVRADKAMLEQIKNFAKDYEEQIVAQTPERRFFSFKYANPAEVANTIMSLSGGTGGGRRGGGGAGAQVKASVAGNQLIVEAPADKFPEIEKLVLAADDPGGKEIIVKTFKQPGSDVDGLARRLGMAFQQKARGGLTAAFAADAAAEIIIASVSKDLMPEAEAMLTQFATEAADITQIEKFFEIKNADANYIADQLRSLLAVKVSQSRGAGAASKINISPDTRLNRVVLYAPRYVIPMAENLVAEFDRVATGTGTFTTIALKNADATGVVNAIKELLAEYFKTKRDLKVVAEPLSNAIIVAGASKQVLDDITTLATERDAAAAAFKPETRIVELQNNSNPGEVVQQLNERFAAKKAGTKATLGSEVTFGVIGGQHVIVNAPTEKLPEILEYVKILDSVPDTDLPVVTITPKNADPTELATLITNVYGGGKNTTNKQAKLVQATVSNATVIVRAPQKLMQPIQDLVKKIDVDNPNELQVRMFDLKRMSAEKVGMQVNLFLATAGTNSKKGSMKPAAFGEPTTNKLIVLAPADKMPFIETLINSIENGLTPPESEPRAYALKTSRADQTAPNIEQMIKAKVMESEAGRAALIQVKVLPDMSTNRVIVYAPDEYQELASSLVKLIDQEVDTGEIIHLIRLQQGDVTAVAQSANAAIQAQSKRSPMNVAASADVNSNTIVLTGLPKDVAKIEKLVTELESTAENVPELQIFKIQNSTTEEVATALKNLLPQTKNPNDMVNVGSDEYSSRLFVTANKRKMRQVEEYIKIIDAPLPIEPDEGGDSVVINNKELHFVTITRGEAFDIAYDVRSHFPDEDKGGPIIDSDWFGQYLKVQCRKGEFPKIEKVIRLYEQNAKEDVGKVLVLRPKNDIAKLQPLLEAQYPGLAVNRVSTQIEAPENMVEELWKEGEAPPKRKEPVFRSVDQVSPYLIDPRLIEGFDFGDPPQTNPVAPRQPVSNSAANPSQQANDWWRSVAPTKNAAPAPSTNTTAPAARGGRDGAKLSILPDGRVAISGSKDAVDEMKEAIDVLEEDLSVGEVIRIFHFKYGDVTAAARILELMFNESASRNPLQMQQQMMQQQMQMQAMQQGGAAALGQGGGGRGGRGGRGGDDEGGGRGAGAGGGLTGALRGLLGGGSGSGGKGRGGAALAGGDRIRIATDVGHNYLILKCDESRLTEIRQLLKELDIPPGNVDVRVFQLKNVDAREAADNIKEALGITRSRQQQQNRGGGLGGLGGFGFPFGGGGFGGRGGNPFGGGGGGILDLMNQQVFTVGGGTESAAKVDSVEIVANQVTNSVLVSAPIEVMNLVETLITKLEGLEAGTSVVIRDRELKDAELQDVLPLLQEVFAATNQRGGGGGPGGGRGSAGSPAMLGPVTVSGDPRANSVIYVCQAKDVEIVEKQIARFDIKGMVNEAETVVLEYGDANAIAQVLEQVFVTGRGGSRGAPGTGGGSSGGTDVRIAPEPITNTITIWAPRAQRDLMFEKVAELDKQYRREIREIPVVYADAEKLADKLSQVFGGVNVSVGGGQGGTGRRPTGISGAQSIANTQGRLVIVGDKSSKKILVRAPDPVFTQMQDLVAAIDQPSEQMQIRTFALKHAEAASVVEGFKAAMTDYISALRATGGSADFDAFTAVPDTRTNSVVVVGTTQTFAFVQQMISAIDAEAGDEQQKQFRIFVLDRTDSGTMADAINSFAAGRSSGGGAAGGRRPGGLPGAPGGGGSASGGPLLDVQAIAEPNSNAVMVFGRPNDIDRVEKDVIQQLEGALVDRTSIASIPVLNTLPSQIISFITPLLDQSGQQQSQQRGGGQRGVAGGGPRLATLIANDLGKTVVVKGSANQIAEIRKYVQEFDNADLVSGQVKVVALSYGQDAEALARDIERIINDGERNLAQSQNRQAKLVSIGADPYTNSLLVYGEPSQYGLVETVVSQLGSIRSSNPTTRIFQLTNLTASDAQGLIDDLQGRRNGSRSGSIRNTGGGGTRGGFNPGGGNTGGRGNFAPQPGRGTGGGQPSAQPGGNRPRPGGGGGGGAPAPARPRGGGGGGGGFLWTPPAEREVDGALTPRIDDLPPIPIVGVATFAPAFGITLMPMVLEVSQTAADEPVADDESEEAAPENAVAPAPVWRRASAPAPGVETHGRRNANRSSEFNDDAVWTARGAIERGRFALATDDDGNLDDELTQAPPVRRGVRSDENLQESQPKEAAKPARPPRQSTRPAGARSNDQTAPASAPRGNRNAADSRPTGRQNGPTDGAKAPTSRANRGAPSEGTQKPTGGRTSPEEVETATNATQPTGSIEGQLRGDVLATPIDSHRIIITGDERDVEFVEQMLRLMESSTPEAQIEVFPLEYAKATSLAPLIQQTVEALLQQQNGTPDRADRFSIIAEARSNSLIVSASETNMDLIAEIIAKLDSDTLKPSEFKAVPLVNIKATEAVAILDKALQKINSQREVQESARASVQAIDRSNSVLIIGTPADISEIERIIEGIDVELPSADSPFTSAEVLVIDLQNAEAEKMATVLNNLIEAEKTTGAAASGGGGAGASGRSGPLVRKLVLTGPDGKLLKPLDLDRPIRIIPEPGRNALIVYSHQKNNEALKEIVTLFDSLPEGADLDVKTFALRYGQAENVAKIVKDLFTEAQKSSVKRPSEKGDSVRAEGVLPASPPGLASRGLPFYVTITSDARSNTVFVIGRKESVLLAAGLIQQLDTPGTELALRSHVISGLKNMNVADLETKLRDILDKRSKALGEKNDARDNAFLMADERSNSMVVFASDDMYKLISDLATQLDSSASYRIVGLEFRHLKAADSARLAAMLQEVFDKRKQADTDVTKNGQKEVLNIVADSRSNSVMLVGTRDYLAEAQNLITNLDQSFDPTLEFKVRPLLLASSSNLATLLKDMVEKSRSNQDSAAAKATPIHIAADVYSNSLLLAASHDDMQQVDRWIDLLDKPAEIGRITRVIPLARGSAETVSKTASDLYAKSGSQGAASDVTVTFDKSTNSVIAVGPSAVVKDIESLVDQMGTAKVASSQVLRSFRLEKADAAAAGALLRNVLSGQGGQVNATGQNTGSGSSGGGSAGSTAAERAAQQIMLVYQQKNDLGTDTFQAMRQDIVITDDLRTNSLFVTAPADSMPLVESLIAVIDVPPTALTVRIYPLRNTDAEDIVTKLRDLFPRSSGSSGGSSGGTGNTQGQIALGDGAAGGRQEVAFTSDSRTNSVIAAGTPGYLDIVDNLLIRLDSRDVGDRVTKVFTPINNPALSIQELLSDYSDKEKAVLDGVQNVSANKKMEQEITSVAKEDINRVIVGMSPRREAEVLELLRELDQPPPQVMIKVLILEVTMDNDLELGVEFAFQDLQFAAAGPNDTNTFDYVGGTDIGAVGAGLGGFTFTITGRDFNFLFRTLQSQGALNVLSRPQIVAMDNQEAKIEITNDVPYVSGTSTSDAGQITTTVQRQDIGIKLDVTPQINPDGFVRMKVVQEVSDFADTSVPVGPGLTAPVFFKRVADTTVTVKDNETVVIGGLITARDEVRETKIPLLGDIPGLGLLFSNRTHSNRRTELLVIMTPTILRTVEDYRAASINERDRAKTISPDTLGSDLMEGLQLKPDEVTDRKTKVQMGPVPDEVLRALGQKQAEQESGKQREKSNNGQPQNGLPDAQPESSPNDYGPQRPGKNAAMPPAAPSADGYEIRDPRLGKASAPAKTDAPRTDDARVAKTPRN